MPISRDDLQRLMDVFRKGADLMEPSDQRILDWLGESMRAIDDETRKKAKL
jgi:hypothetical protein